MTIQVIQAYYDSFNRAHLDDFCDLLSDDVVHEINEGKQEVGKKAFRAFMERMNRHYREKAVDVSVLVDESGKRASAEFFIEGTYLKTDPGLPPAEGQKYRLRCGAFFELRGNQITRVTNYYNLSEWISQITCVAANGT